MGCPRDRVNEKVGKRENFELVPWYGGQAERGDGREKQGIKFEPITVQRTVCFCTVMNQGN